MIPLQDNVARKPAAILLGLSFCGLAAAQEPRRGFYTPLSADAIHSVVAEHGMVVAQEKTAARIGTDILKRGGNAVDAAVATGFAMAVTYPRAGNIGGGGFMVIHSVDRHEDVAIDYRETAPAATTSSIFLGADGKPDNAKSRDSALGIGIPGTAGGPRAGAREIRLRKIHARGIVATGDRSGPQRRRYRRRRRRHPARMAPAAGGLAFVGKNLFSSRRIVVARG